jgi:hypothetical protein
LSAFVVGRLFNASKTYVLLVARLRPIGWQCSPRCLSRLAGHREWVMVLV